MKEIFFPVVLFAVSMTLTPGPNNMLLTASGARYGYRRTVPLIAGILGGILSMLVLWSMGLGVLFDVIPWAKTALKLAGSAYILYLAVKIATSSVKEGNEESEGKPLSFFQGFAFQYLNPKAYIATISAMSVYPLEGQMYIPSTILITGIFAVICPISISIWAGFGTVLNKLLQNSRYTKIVNYSMGAVTALSVVFILL